MHVDEDAETEAEQESRVNLGNRNMAYSSRPIKQLVISKDF